MDASNEAGDSTITYYDVPVLLSKWPWSTQENPFMQKEREASDSWVLEANALDGEALEVFKRSNLTLLAALTYPRTTQDEFRVACDFMNLFFVLDALTDVARVDVSRQLVQAVMDGMCSPDDPQESLIGELYRQFWKRTEMVASPSTQHRLIEKMRLYTDSVVEESRDRETTHVRNLDDYLVLRRDTGAAEPSFVLLQLGLNLPPLLFEDPTILALERCACDLIHLGNDVYSYNVEQARGDGFHNIVTVVQNQFRLSLHDALNWVAKYHDGLVDDFMALYGQMPSFGIEYDGDVKHYVDGLANWVRGNDSWSFKSGRYFGMDGPNIQIHRRVPLLPRNPRAEEL